MRLSVAQKAFQRRARCPLCRRFKLAGAGVEFGSLARNTVLSTYRVSSTESRTFSD